MVGEGAFRPPASPGGNHGRFTGRTIVDATGREPVDWPHLVTLVSAEPGSRRDRPIVGSDFDAVAYLHDGLQLAGWTTTDLWIGVLSIGGAFGRRDIEDLLSGAQPLTEGVYDLLAAALNECFTERGLDHPMRYAHELTVG